MNGLWPETSCFIVVLYTCYLSLLMLTISCMRADALLQKYENAMRSITDRV